MNNFLSITKKEVRELLTPATIIPILVMSLIFGGLGNMIGGAAEEATDTPTVGLITLDDGPIAQRASDVIADSATVAYNDTDASIDQGISTVRENDGTAVLVIPANFSQHILDNRTATIMVYWVMEGAGIMDSISSSAVQDILQTVNRNISEMVIAAGGVNATFALSPIQVNETTVFKGRDMAGISPGDISSVLSSQFTVVPVIMMIIIIMAGGMVISSMGMEKENKTLETLLTLPVKRRTIVAGKIAGSAVVGLVMAIIYMIGFSYYATSFTQGGNVDLAAYGLQLTALDYGLITLSLFMALTAGLSLCMVLGTFAKNYKSAQTLTVPVSVLALIPMFLVMFRDFATLPLPLKGLLFAIPFSHPMMAMRALLFDDYLLVFAGIIYVALFAVALIAVAVWIFSTDRLLTGRLQRKG